MIRAVILDVDGVVVGDRAGFNFPDPHPDVIAALRAVRRSGVYLSLCTAKPAFAIEKIIRDAQLDNLHITDGGAVLIDPLDRKVGAVRAIPADLAARIVRQYRQRQVYQELYTADEYYIPAGAQCGLTAKHALTLQREPRIIDDLDEFVARESLVKLFLIAKNEAEKAAVAASFAADFAGAATLSWTLHPNTLPWQFGVVTAPGVSKRHGAEEIARHSGVPPADMLGVGDTGHDWQFMELCGRVAAMGNAGDELQLRVRRRNGKGFVGPAVNDNGIIAVFRHFGLL